MLGAAAIEPEHLLLGLFREDRALMARFVGRGPNLLEEIRQEVERQRPGREKFSTSIELPLSPEAKRVLAYARDEGDRLQHRHIGTEHLLLGLLMEEGTLAAEILRERGLRLAAVRDEIARMSGEARDEMKSAARDRAESSGQEEGAAGLLSELRCYGRRLGEIADALCDTVEGGIVRRETRGEAESAAAPGGRGPTMRRRGRTVLGVEKLLHERLDLLRGARIGLVCNQASVDHQLRHVADLFDEQREVKLTTLFGPQHGIRGDVQDNMIETPHTFDAATGKPVYSLYSETREPTEEMLKEVDTLVFDMQDVGCRIYTFIYTLANCMRAAQKYGKRVVVCDRPNPINGRAMAGTVLEPEYASFVGYFPLPTRHGMTVCELARMFKGRWGLACELETVEMEGWEREQWFDETDAPWVMPSPNMPTLETATVFPGAVHVEGTGLSEGRGTTRPFELIGAPYIEAREYARRLNGLGLPGAYFRACYFQPTFQKHARETCGGVQLHVTERGEFEPVLAGVAAIKVAYELYGDYFRWKEPPYEYVYDKNPFDVIAGTDRLRKAFERGDTLTEIESSWGPDLERFAAERAGYLLY